MRIAIVLIGQAVTARLLPSIAMVKTLLSKGKVKVKGLYSAKKDKTYDAYVTYEDTGKYINFKLDFKR